MTQITALLEKQEIYRNNELNQYIINLENKFCIKNEIDFFKNLVNFSKNFEIPFHGWFKYREGYSHTLIRHLILREYISPTEIIVDPFCGSGTTMTEAALCGYSAFGVDVNPLSAFISNVKTLSYSKENIMSLETSLELFLKLENIQTGTTTKYKDAQQYFDISQFNELISIKALIDSIESNTVRDLLLVGYLSIIEQVSNRKRDGNGLITRPTKVIHVVPLFLEKMNTILNDLKSQVETPELKCKAAAGNATNLVQILTSNFINSKVGAIMFSPPYANSFDYFESYKLELLMGDFVNSISEIKHLRDHAVRSFVNTSSKPIIPNPIIDAIAREIELAIPAKELLTGKKDTRTRKVPAMIRGYFNDMREILKECSHLLEPERKCYIVVDQSAYMGVWIPTDLLLGMIAEEFNMKVKEIIICRKARTSPQQLKKFPYLNDLLRESIVVLEKC